MNVNDMIDAYEKHLAQGSVKTVQRFAPMAVVIRAALGHRDHLEVTPAEIREMLIEATKTYSGGNQYCWLGYTKAAWLYPERSLGHEDPDRHNPFRKNGCLSHLFPQPKPKVRAYLLPEVIDAICASPTQTRPRLVLELFRGTGIRLGELLALEVRDVQDAVAGSGDGRRLVLRKPKSGQDEETVPLPLDVAQMVKRYVQKKKLAATDRLFPISTQAVQDTVRRAGERFGIKLSPHDLRRSWASRKSRQGVPIDVIRAGLRHKSETTTRGYIAPVSFGELMDMTDRTEAPLSTHAQDGDHDKTSGEEVTATGSETVCRESPQSVINSRMRQIEEREERLRRYCSPTVRAQIIEEIEGFKREIEAATQERSGGG